MLKPSYLNGVSDRIIELYSKLEYEVKMDMARRIKNLGKLTDETLRQADILQQCSMLKIDINKIIKRYDKPTQKLIQELFNAAMYENARNDLKYVSSAKRSMTDSQKQRLETALKRFEDSGVINKTFNARKKLQKLADNIQRMTLTVADNSQKQFLSVCNDAYMKVSTGSFSWDKAYKDAVNELASDNVDCVEYTGSGRAVTYSIETATKMNILTGINQSASEQTLLNAQELGVEMFEVDAHLGARDKDNFERPWANHAAWQGGIYTRAELESVCGLGQADGLCGINCKHSFYPYFEGMTPDYDSEELDDMENQTVTFNDTEMSRYDAEQKLRNIERNIRSYKTDADFQSIANGADSDECIAARKRLYSWQEKARDFCEQTGLQRNYTNEYIGTKSGIQPRGLKN